MGGGEGSRGEGSGIWHGDGLWVKTATELKTKVFILFLHTFCKRKSVRVTSIYTPIHLYIYDAITRWVYLINWQVQGGLDGKATSRNLLGLSIYSLHYPGQMNNSKLISWKKKLSIIIIN